MMRGRILFCAFGMLAAGCASTGPSKETLLALASASRSSEQVGNVVLNSKILSTTYQRDPDDLSKDYVIGSGDLLVIWALNVSELEKLKVRVGTEGLANLPLLGTIRVKGLTARGLETDIADRLREKYLHDPQVSVFIEEYKSQRVAVLGEVNKPGVYEVSERRTLTDMLANAGGLSANADQVVYLLRRTASAAPGPSGSGELLKINLENLLAGGDASVNVKIEPGDVISVPKTGEFFLGGAVKRPGAYPIKGKLAVDQAVYLGDGLSDDADVTDVQVLRDAGGPHKELFQVNLEQLKREGKPGLAIQKNDVVFVGTSGSKVLLFGALDFFKSILRIGITAGKTIAF